MYVIQISDPAMFLEKASETVVEVELTAEYVPKIKDSKTVLMVPVIKLYYSLSFLDGNLPTLWTHVEVRHPNDDGEASLEGTLLEAFREDPERYKYRVNFRGSVPLVQFSNLRAYSSP